jgi:hypothetical protein
MPTLNNLLCEFQSLNKKKYLIYLLILLEHQFILLYFTCVVVNQYNTVIISF